MNLTCEKDFGCPEIYNCIELIRNVVNGELTESQRQKYYVDVCESPLNIICPYHPINTQLNSGLREEKI